MFKKNFSCYLLAIGPFCDIKQDVTSWNYTEGAAVALEMQEYERERKWRPLQPRFLPHNEYIFLFCFIFLGDQCPMYFDDGSNPWQDVEQTIYEFDFLSGSASSKTLLLTWLNTFFVVVAPLVFSKILS